MMEESRMTRSTGGNRKMRTSSTLLQFPIGLFLLFGAIIMNVNNNSIQFGSCFVPTSISPRIAVSSSSTSFSSSPLSLSLSPSSSQLNPNANHFDNLRKAFPTNANIVQAGGWTNLERLSTDPKGELVKFVVEGLTTGNNAYDTNKIQPQQQRSSSSNRNINETIEALCLLLYGMGKGFTAKGIHGDWDLVFTLQGNKSPSFQKIVGRKETVGFSKNYYNTARMIFTGDIRFWKYGKVETAVKYTPTSDSYSKSSDGKIVVRRILCQIINAFFKWWKLPGIPFPLPKNVGYLDIIYLDHEIRVTKGNRGGLFVHFRPDYLQQVLL